MHASFKLFNNLNSSCHKIEQYWSDLAKHQCRPKLNPGFTFGVYFGLSLGLLFYICVHSGIYFCPLGFTSGVLRVCFFGPLHALECKAGPSYIIYSPWNDLLSHFFCAFTVRSQHVNLHSFTKRSPCVHKVLTVRSAFTYRSVR